jgi:hypothetical protein
VNEEAVAHWRLSRQKQTNKLVKRGHAVTQLAEALRYVLESRGFDSILFNWDFSFTSRNEYQGHLLGGKECRCEGLTFLPTSCADSVILIKHCQLKCSYVERFVLNKIQLANIKLQLQLYSMYYFYWRLLVTS